MEMTARREFRHRQLGNEALDQYGLSALNPNIHVTLGASIYAEILGVAEQAKADRVGVGSHRP
jgi:hypothetical protein